MEPKAKKRFCNNETIHSMIEKYGIEVESSTFQAATLWPGKSSDNAFNPQKHQKVKAYDVPQAQRLFLVHDDGSAYGIPSTNIIGMVYV